MAFRSSFLLVSQLLCLAQASPITKAPRATTTSIPGYALEFAPYSHLWSEEEWWPSDIATHVQHVTPEVSYTAVAGRSNVTLENLNSFTSSVYLTSNDNVEDNPDWLLSTSNTPSSDGYSAAPATIICADKGEGTVDVFYFYFYSYNHGNKYSHPYPSIQILEYVHLHQDIGSSARCMETILEIGSIQW